MAVTILAACGDNLDPVPCELGPLPGPDPRIEAISGDGELVAASIANGTTRDVYVANRDCHDVPELAIPDAAYAIGCGPAFLAPRTALDGDRAAELVGWVRGGTATTLALNIDPGALHCARDGAHASVEAGDVDGDGQIRVDLEVVRSSDLDVRFIGAYDHARARFSHDSLQVLYGGDANAISRQPVDGGNVTVVAPAAYRRWEPGRDNRSVVYLDGTNALLTTDYDGITTPLATDLLGSIGKEFDVASDDTVAYITGPNQELATASLAGDGRMTLIASGVVDIVDHYAGLVFVDLDTGLVAQPTSGESATVFGPTATIADHTGDAVVVIDSDAHAWWSALPPAQPWIDLGPDVAQAAIAADGRVVLRNRSGALNLTDPMTLEARPLLDTDIGPFALAASRMWLAAIAGGVVMKIPLPRY